MNIAARLLAIALFSTPAYASTVSLKAADGVALSGQLEGSGPRAVVLVHGHAEDHTAVAELMKAMSSAKIQVLSIDLRGNGASKGTIDPLKADADVTAAIAYLRTKGQKQIALVGAGMGGNLAFLAASKDPTVDAVVMISPALNHQGVKASAALESYGDRPILMVTSSSDGLGTKAANMIGERLSKATIETVAVDGSGSKLVKYAPDLPGLVLNWLAEVYKADEATGPNLATENEGLKTSGVKLGER